MSRPRSPTLSHGRHRWSGFVGYSGGLQQAPNTLVARIVAVMESYLHLIAFALLTGVLTSTITSANLQPKLLYDQISGFPATWKACVPAPIYIDVYDYVGRLQVRNMLIVIRVVAYGTP